MPYADPVVSKVYARLWARNKRLRKRYESDSAPPPPPTIPADPKAQAGLICEWSRDTLIIPPGHPRSGKPLELEPFQFKFLQGALSSRESLLCLGRKNGKTALIAVLMLAHIAEGAPLLSAGWRGGIVSLSKVHARELLKIAVGLVESSGLDLTVRRTPYPGTISNDVRGSVIEVLSSDKNAGHSTSYDLVCLDELGLFEDRSRELVMSVRSSVSAKDGRTVSISIRGFSDMLTELENRGKLQSTYVQIHEPSDPACRLDDEPSWYESNPGLGTIKSLDYMRTAAAAAIATPSDSALFQAYDLNLPGSPTEEVIVTVEQWTACEASALPPAEGLAYVGVDLGGSRSMASIAVYWPLSGRFQAWGCFPETPSLRERGSKDGVGTLYERMQEEGNLYILGERVIDVSAFIAPILADIPSIGGLGFDRFREMEMMQIVDNVGYRGPLYARGTGASARADGSHDVRSFTRAVITGRILTTPSLLMRSALRFAVLRHDAAGNPALSKVKQRGRIDAVQAAVIALGIADLQADHSIKKRRRFAVCR